jgi:hypothetical protein
VRTLLRIIVLLPLGALVFFIVEVPLMMPISLVSNIVGVACPRCGALNSVVTEDGRHRCRSCGHHWTLGE